MSRELSTETVFGITELVFEIAGHLDEKNLLCLFSVTKQLSIFGASHKHKILSFLFIKKIKDVSERNSYTSRYQEIIPSFTRDQEQDNIMQSLFTIIKACNKTFGEMKDKKNHDNDAVLNKIKVLFDYESVKAIYNEMRAADTQLSQWKNEITFSHNTKHKEIMQEGWALFFLAIPPISFFTLIVFGINVNKSHLSKQDAYILLLLLMPPVLLYQLGWAIKETIQLYRDTHRFMRLSEKLENPFDEFRHHFEIMWVNHPDRPNDNSHNARFFLNEINQKDTLMALFLGDKFKNSNSTAIINIQEQMRKHPYMSPQICFELIQTEICNRHSSGLTNFFRKSGRHEKIQELYEKIDSRQRRSKWGRLNDGLDLLKSHDDRDALITFINGTPSFVETNPFFEPDVTVSLGQVKV